MKVVFLEDCEVEVIESLDAAMDDAESTTERFYVDEVVEFEVFGYAEDHKGDEDKNFMNVQFPDGSVVFGLSASWVKEYVKA